MGDTRTFQNSEVPQGLDLGILHQEVAALIPTLCCITGDSFQFTLVFSSALTSQEDSDLLQALADHYPDTLDRAQQRRMDKVDLRTAQIMSEGFVYQGITFSESATMQRNLLALNARDLRLALSPILPFYVSSMDNRESIQISSVQEFLSFYDAAFNHGMSAYASGNGIKESIRQITNDPGQPDTAPNYHSLQEAIAAVEAVVDPR